MAIAACIAPLFAIPLGGLLSFVFCPHPASHPTPAQAEIGELASALLPQGLAFVFAICILGRASKHKRRVGIVLSCVGMALSVIMSISLFILIVSSHAWLD